MRPHFPKPINTDDDAPARKPMACAHCGGVLKLLRVLRPAKERIDAISDSRLCRSAPGAAQPDRESRNDKH